MSLSSPSAVKLLSQAPRIYMGTMTFGWNQASQYVDETTAKDMITRFIKLGGKHVDTARIYSAGECEPIVGNAIKGFEEIILGTKAAPSQPGGLSPGGIQSQIDASLEALQVNHLAEYYLHQPDTTEPLLDSLMKVHELVRAGVIGRVGMSNYHAHEVKRAFQLCDEHGLTKPSVYQGLYNPLNRAVENELLPLLKEHSCSFIAYNPLAAGLLTGKYTYTSEANEIPKGRFKDNLNYLPRFFTPACCNAVDLIRLACAAADISMVQATYRWLLHHSALGSNDGLLLGASSLDQLDSNLDACTVDINNPNAGLLPLSLVTAFNDAWEKEGKGQAQGEGEGQGASLRDSAFAYFRQYSSDMPGRDALPQGAGYVAHGPK